MQPERPFNAPWEAQAFAMAVHLNERGVFSWKEWAEMLGAEIAVASSQEYYYDCWLKALEKILEKNYILKHEEYVDRIADWVEADRRTPHGAPVVLSRAG